MAETAQLCVAMVGRGSKHGGGGASCWKRSAALALITSESETRSVNEAVSLVYVSASWGTDLRVHLGCFHSDSKSCLYNRSWGVTAASSLSPPSGQSIPSWVFPCLLPCAVWNRRQVTLFWKSSWKMKGRMDNYANDIIIYINLSSYLYVFT